MGPLSRAAGAAAVIGMALVPLAPGRSAVERADQRTLAALVAHRPDAVRPVATGVTTLSEPVVVVPVLAAAMARAARRGTPWLRVLATVGWAAAGIGLRRVLAQVVGRGRPPRSWWWHRPSGFSYPSRHVTWAVLGFGAAADLVDGVPFRRAASALTCGAAGTRLLLAVHWPSDVAAALVFSAGWRALGPARAGQR